MPHSDLIPLDRIQTHILVIRGCRVLLDSDLASFYGVQTSRLNEAVKRNANRFPSDFRFQLTPEEVSHLISQFAISNPRRGGLRKMPFAFTEHGALMAATVLNSPRAVQSRTPIIATWPGWADRLGRSCHRRALGKDPAFDARSASDLHQLCP